MILFGERIIEFRRVSDVNSNGWLGFLTSGKDDMKVIRETEKAFTVKDMMRFARYVDDGRRSESELQRVFSTWLHGPGGDKRVNVIKDNGDVVYTY